MPSKYPLLLIIRGNIRISRKESVYHEPARDYMRIDWMMFHCTLEQFFKIKHFKIVANEDSF